MWAPVAAPQVLPPEPAAAEAPLKEIVEGMVARIVGLEARVTSLEATIVGLEEKIGGLLAMIERLDTKVEKLPYFSNDELAVILAARRASSSDDVAWKMVPGDDEELAERQGRAGEKP